MQLSQYRSLGRSGLAVSPLALGTMTFGASRWGCTEEESRAIFNRYVDEGGNFLDTANLYSGGRSEEMLGNFVSDRSLRDQVVVATKSGFAAGSGPHSGGNGAKHIYAALDGSLRRLRTDYVDVYWVHVWDSMTPAEELLETMSTLVRAGKVRYWGISNAPAWFVAKVATLACARGLPGPIALQYFYSLTHREIEIEHLPLAAECGMGVLPWSPLSFGLLSGKYERGAVEASGPLSGGLPSDADLSDVRRPAEDKRLSGNNPFGDSLFNDRNWQIVDVLNQVAQDAQETPARVALSWVMGRPGVTSTLMGVSRLQQLIDNLGSLIVVLTAEHRVALDAVSAKEQPILYNLFTPSMRQHAIHGGYAVTPW